MTETELLFTRVLGCDRMALYLNKDRRLNRDEVNFISSALKRRIKSEPIQYILGKTEFMGLEFKVNEAVLIPRPETEILVATAIEYAKREKFGRILDLGTGSGCIAVSLAKYSTDLEIDASDISGRALETAGENASAHGVGINLIRSDLFSALGYKEYAMIVSNPPYIMSAEIGKLQPELNYEPALALDGGADGLDFYRRIIREAPDYLKNSGWLLLEIGFGQKPGIEKIFLGSGRFEIAGIIKDYNNLDRVVVARKAD
ncbi:MAG: peptide chain release factor N(5)-glutamine methyltransferase [Candidatus Omnitrophica bacterium]|nr:peptide chain release factor N(5)-glutamine methyltransferase [Candidatus Omnitrophota bacterium]MDD5518055.1 peptide chain release factor N(5)-glutamine methyltransferase [Candidatus Omnitrophota bacterium]